VIDKNALGERGEAIFYVITTKFQGKKPLFRPASLGSKWPVADYAVELVGKPGRFFLVQVKASTLGFTKAGRIRVKVTFQPIVKLLASPVPAYVVAVDEPNERAYIVEAQRRIGKRQYHENVRIQANRIRAISI